MKVITFDAGNTLIRLNQPVGVTYAAVAERFGVKLAPASLERGFKAAWKSVPPLPEAPGPRPDDGRSWWRAVVIQTLELTGEKVEPFDNYFDAVYREFGLPGIWRLEPGALDLLSDLRVAGFRLGIISNFDLRLRHILEHLGVLDFFEQIIISSQIGADKPSPRIFQAAIERFGVEPQEMLHVGDDKAADGDGARQAGMQTFILGLGGSGLKELRERVGL
ncbi:MAG: HAD-IA family hydrolase [Verrucomicrobia bacterium]|nr:HAD-IA family hydrolase [Verrucomicrobiota bacterium]MBV9275272.1 HAD-IA family hydrolase [Verrucomicrobiota bacterium]